MSAHVDNKAAEAGVSQAAVEPEHDENGELVLPPGWLYRRFQIGNWLTPWYASPKVQLIIVSFVCFLCPGMFNALGGLGGGGKTDATLADDMNTALYSTFAVFGFLGGTIVNKLGVKVTLGFGGLGYCIYAISLLVSVHHDVFAFNIIAGALLGLCAALLWTAQGTIMVSYPKEADKGKYFAIFWAIFNMGAVIGSLIPLGQNFHVKTNVTVSDGTYIGFIVLMALGAVCAMFIASAREVVRTDGTKVVLMKNPTWWSEIYGLYESLKFEPTVILLFPMFWSSNWFYTYQQNAVNGAHFDTRTKALNSCLYYLAQIFGAMALGYALDYTNFRRSLRGKIAWGFLMAMTLVIYGGGYAFQKQYTRADTSADDWSSSNYVGPMFLYIFYGMFDSFWQCTVYWYMGALSNSGRRTANYVGFYKGLQSAGAAVMWSLDSRKISFMSEFASNWAILGASLIVAAPVVLFKISDHNRIEDDLRGTDETLADVVPAAALADKHALEHASQEGEVV
ncbi:DUF895 domain membrane protein [Mollisia scopiformis]|uniref:DUF895 domain membrane protein n=1 Tax=Mollisia scopiformis TaxID=149040 RepID=A0A194X9G3_MOLSC|nr:DUF895 domain membrane protein [Mollisia scopiformis]KUJ16810.1 DUF895 domain membrane protein [Mollisia scopiformis]